MRYSKLFPKTLRDAPADEVAINAKYLLRGGYIDKLMSGSYTLLPLGKKVEQKIEQIVREEMNATGAQEMLMPLLHPKEIWSETGRWDKADEVMYKLKKSEKEFALSFTHEEIFLDLVRKHATTYRDFPITAYHFSTKFRSELRAKSGILRGREFLMKDLYSAHTSEEDLNKYYDEVKEAYLKIFKRLGLDAVVTEAAGGVFTDTITHEFQVLSESGEDEIIYCPGGDFSQNIEISKVEEGKQCDLGHGPLKKVKAIEVGNIFRFGAKGKITMETLNSVYKTAGFELEIEKLLVSISKKDLQACLNAISTLSENGTDFKVFTERLAQTLHRMLISADFKDLKAKEIKSLLASVNESYRDIKFSVLPQIPLELVIVEYCLEGEHVAGRKSPVEKSETTSGERNAKSEPPSAAPNPHGALFRANGKSEDFFAELLARLKTNNHSIAGVLRGCKLVELGSENIIFETRFKFHKDKLSDNKTAAILDAQASEILKENVHVVVNLTEK